MGKYLVKLESSAVKEILAIKKSGDKASIIRLEKIIKELSEHPFEGIGKPEALKYELSGYWSRRINSKDRLIYKVFEEKVLVVIISAKGHYLK